jgi:secreted trypsin-like serine protease
LTFEGGFDCIGFKGDSGGGLIAKFEDGQQNVSRRFLLGVVSMGSNCAKLFRQGRTPVAQVLI